MCVCVCVCVCVDMGPCDWRRSEGRWPGYGSTCTQGSSRRPCRYLCGSPPVAFVPRRRAREAAPG